jgi:glycerophosphoryl diester phosphodiesterase
LSQHALNAPDWLIARPIAHRGLHDKAKGRIENSLAAAEAAVAQNYAIECDVQLSQDGEAIVFHDFALDRLTAAQGRVDDLTAEALQKITYRDGLGTLPTLTAFLTTLSARTPLIIEIKSRFTGDMRLAERVAALTASYAGPIAIKSFDPAALLALRSASVPCPIGLISQARYDHDEWLSLSIETRARLKDFSFYSDIRPDFLSWSAQDLPHAVPRLCHDGIGMPVMAWTLRSAEESTRVSPWTDQIIFEGFSA